METTFLTCSDCARVVVKAPKLNIDLGSSCDAPLRNYTNDPDDKRSLLFCIGTFLDINHEASIELFHGKQ